MNLFRLKPHKINLNIQTKFNNQRKRVIITWKSEGKLGSGSFLFVCGVFPL